MCGVFCEGVAVRYAQIEELRQHHPVGTMCRILEVSESGYHARRRRPPSARKQENHRLETEIKAAHQRTRETYGPERLQSDLADHGIQTSVYRIKRIRTRLGLHCKQMRKFKATTNSNHALLLAPNLLDRQFTVAAPNRAWVTDIIYVATDEGWLYLAGIKDLFNGELVGYTMSDRMTTALVSQALFRAVAAKHPAKG
jgi:putative transposase